MNYFHAVSVYQLINMILYRKKYCNNEENCLVIRDILIAKIRDMSYIENLFDKVVIYGDFWSEKEIEKQENFIVNYYDQLFDSQELDLQDSNIIVGCAHNTFGMYLSIKEIPFTFLEDAAGLLTRPEILDAINVKQNALKYEMICKYGLISGQSPVITRYMCDFVAQNENFNEEMKSRSIDFCVIKELNELDEDERRKIMHLFSDIERIDLNSNVMVILTQHFANLRSLLFEEQILIYQTFIDYYAGRYEIVLKPHPDDLLFYPMIFPDITIIKEKFPAEFLPFLFTNKPAAIATISSTSSFSLRSGFNNVVEMGTSFERDFTHRACSTYPCSCPCRCRRFRTSS